MADAEHADGVSGSQAERASVARTATSPLDAALDQHRADWRARAIHAEFLAARTAVSQLASWLDNDHPALSPELRKAAIGLWPLVDKLEQLGVDLIDEACRG